MSRRLQRTWTTAVWVGVGAALTVACAMMVGGEPASVAKVALLLGIVGGVVEPELLH